MKRECSKKKVKVKAKFRPQACPCQMHIWLLSNAYLTIFVIKTTVRSFVKMKVRACCCNICTMNIFVLHCSFVNLLFLGRKRVKLFSWSVPHIPTGACYQFCRWGRQQSKSLCHCGDVTNSLLGMSMHAFVTSFNFGWQRQSLCVTTLMSPTPCYVC